MASLQHNYFVYIVANPSRSTIYIGVTNDLKRRLLEHYESRGIRSTFAGRYYCYELVYFERFQMIDHAIDREKKIKKWRREKKNKLIQTFNPGFKNLNPEIWDTC